MDDTLNIMSTPEVRQFVQDIVLSSSSVQRGLKLAPFDGTPPQKVAKFLEDFDEFADSYGWNDKERLTKIAIYLTDAAKIWYRLYAKERVNKEKISWSELKQELKTFFLPQIMKPIYVSSYKAVNKYKMSP